MRVSRNLRGDQSQLRHARSFANVQVRQSLSLTPSGNGARSKIRQREVRAPVAAVNRPDRKKEPRVVADGKQLAMTKSPAGRREVTGEQTHFSKKRRDRKSVV